MALIDNLSKTFDPKAAADKYYPEWEAAGSSRQTRTRRVSPTSS